MARLTPKQARVLRCIEGFIAQRGYSPTLDELAAELRRAKPTVQQYLRALEARGAIARRRYAHRSIELAEPPQGPPAPLRLPLLGRIAAGQPIEAVEVPETLDVAASLGLVAGRRELFALQVVGDSMIEEGIFDGDYVVVERRDDAENGQVVVALLPDNTATLKKFFRERARVRLQPANPNLKPVYARQVAIQGIVRGVFRTVR